MIKFALPHRLPTHTAGDEETAEGGSEIGVEPASVKKTLLWEIVHIGRLAFRSRNQGPGCSFCSRIAGHRLAEKERFVHRHRNGGALFEGLVSSESYGQSANQESGISRLRLSQILDFEGWDSQVRREFPRTLDSETLSVWTPSLRTGRTCALAAQADTSLARLHGASPSDDEDPLPFIIWRRKP